MKKSLTLIIFFLATIIFYIIVLFGNNRISFDLLSIFPANYPEVERLEAYQKFDSSQKILFEITPKNSEYIKIFKEELQKTYGIKKVINNIKDFSSPKFNQFINETSLLRSNLQLPENQNKEWVKAKLIQLKKVLYTSPFLLSSDIIKNDPLDIFTEIKPSLLGIKSIISPTGHLISPNGTIMMGETHISVSNIAESSKMVDAIKSLIHTYRNDLTIKYFSPHRYSVENSRALQKIITIMLIFITLAIFLFYWKVVGSIRLILATYAVIGASILLSFIITTQIYSTLSIFTLAFSTTVLGLAIDYSAHYYVTGNLYEKPYKINRDIFLAYFSSAAGLLLLSFSDFPLLKQIGLFCSLGLTFSFFGTTWLLPRFGDFKFDNKTPMFSKSKLKYRFFYVAVAGSILLIIILLSNMHIDSNLRNLDYNNKITKPIETYFNHLMSAGNKICLISANSREVLLEKTEKIKSEFKDQKVKSLFITDFLPSRKIQSDRIKQIKTTDWTTIKILLDEESKKLGFKTDFFKNTYVFNQLTILNSYDKLSNTGMQIIHSNNKYYTAGLVEQAALPVPNVYFLNSETILKEMQKEIFYQFYLIIGITILLICSGLAMVYKNLSKVVVSTAFILMPMAAALTIMKLFRIELNILHLFSFLMILIAGIDYGIYYNTAEKFHTIRFALFISAVTTLINFIPFLFTNTGALISTAIPIVTGIMTILIIALLKGK